MVLYDPCACKGKNKDFFLPKGNIAQLNFLLLLTHPHFSKLSGTKFIHHLQSLSGNLPLILSPGSLRGGGFTGTSQPLAQTIRCPYRYNTEVWEKSKNGESQTKTSITDRNETMLTGFVWRKAQDVPKPKCGKKTFVTCKQFYKKTQQTKMGARVRNTN